MPLSETQIRYAMHNTGSNNAASLFLRVHYLTYRKYAKQYIDTKTGKTLWDIHLNQSGLGIVKNLPINKRPYPLMSDILAGNCSSYPAKYLKRRIIKEGVKPEICEICGYHEKRITDQKVPLVLEWMNGDIRDHRQENLRLVCYNCVFTNIGDITVNSKNRNWSFK